MDNLIKMMNYKYLKIVCRNYRVRTGIVHHQYRRRKRMIGRSCWCGPGTCSSRHTWLVFSAWEGKGQISRHYYKSIIMSYHLGRDEDRTIGVKPIVNKFRVLLRLTILNIILWST